MTERSGAPLVAVVGAGPAGLMAAAEAARRGCRVALFDEAPRPGGQIYRQSTLRPNGGSAVGLQTEQTRKKDVLARFEAERDRIDYHSGATAHALFAGPELQVVYDDKSHNLRPSAVILATGVGERGAPFPGWTLPGVMYAGGVQALLKSQSVRAGERVAIAGLGPLPMAVAAQLVEAGATVACLALAKPLSRMAGDPIGLWSGREVLREGLAYVKTLRRAGVEMLNGWVPQKVEGATAVERLTLAKLDASGESTGPQSRAFDVDLVAINFGFTANSELARMAGVPCTFDLARGGWIPETDDFGRTTLEGVFVAGDGAGLRGSLGRGRGRTDCRCRSQQLCGWPRLGRGSAPRSPPLFCDTAAP